MKPRIGITTFFDSKPRGVYSSVGDHYIRSVSAAGGLPFMLPTAPSEAELGAYLDALDGLLFTGGADVSSVLFGQEPSRQVTNTCLARDRFELALFALAHERGMPVMGICRGHQLINIAMGGDLYQDIHASLPDAGGHKQETDSMEEPYHHVDILDEESRIFAAFGERRILTNSFHHQAVNHLAPGLRATARAPDGILEAYEGDDSKGFILCVQFHPEGFTRRFPIFVRLFEELVKAAVAWRA
ncbi:MAG: gamma-glutamyl-gamma-aminobutyrate hydrolase family protein [Spirochaetes bacterium]|nr:gamma-glutamyl-gamma-aminobutyrate hydrolase family protein [Spirochaetota bacterium]